MRTRHFQPRSFAGAMALVGLFALAACSSRVKVQTDYNPNANFSGLHTFAWLPVPPARTGDPRADSAILAGRVRRSVIADLTSKGYREVAPNASPDFYVAYQAAVDQKINVQSTPAYYGYGGWWGGMPVAMGTSTTVHQYELGTLILDIVDRERDDLIWRGSGQAKLKKNDTRTSAERDQAMREAVAAILADFPPTTPNQ